VFRLRSLRHKPSLLAISSSFCVFCSSGASVDFSFLPFDPLFWLTGRLIQFFEPIQEPRWPSLLVWRGFFSVFFCFCSPVGVLLVLGDVFGARLEPCFFESSIILRRLGRHFRLLEVRVSNTSFFFFSPFCGPIGDLRSIPPPHAGRARDGFQLPFFFSPSAASFSSRPRRTSSIHLPQPLFPLFASRSGGLCKSFPFDFPFNPCNFSRVASQAARSCPLRARAGISTAAC